MKKLFFFRSSASNNENKNDSSPPTDEKVGGAVDENIFQSPKDLCSKSRSSVSTSGLRRSFSFSSASFLGADPLCDQSISSLTTTNCSSPQPGNPSRCRSLTPERPRSKTQIGKRSICTRKACTVEKLDSPDSSDDYRDSSGSSSYSCSQDPLRCGSDRLTHESNEVLDLYIDGEQHQERNIRPKNSPFQRKPSCNGNGSGWRPPRVQPTAPVSPTWTSNELPRSYSFRDVRDSQFSLPTKFYSKRNEVGPNSPKKLSKNTVGRFSNIYRQKSKNISRELDPEIPTTVEDIFEDYLPPDPSTNSDDIPYNTMNDAPLGMYAEANKYDEDLELRRKAKEAKERILHLSEELEQENLLQDDGFRVSELLQTIRNLAESRISLALEVSAQLQCRISDRASAKEELRAARVELDSQTRRLEKEKNELKIGLEKELDRRSSDWSSKFEKYQSEEQRLRERVRELAEQNVSFQRELSSNSERELECQSRITILESKSKDVITRLEEERDNNQDLQQTLSELRDKFTGVEADLDSIQRSFKEKEKENKELQKAVSRLHRTSSDQEKTINGLRQGFNNKIERKHSLDKSDFLEGKLQAEIVRVAGVEQTLRRDVESYRLEVESLRHENIYLFARLRNEGGGSAFLKLDQELQTRVEFLQNQGLTLFNESSQLCAKLLELVKAKIGPTDIGDQEAKNYGLDGYFLVECDMKIQSLKRGIENLKRSLQNISSLLHEKPKISEGGRSGNLNCNASEDHMELELKAETLLTRALREKLLCKQQEIEQLQAELATAVMGHDILKSEVQCAMDGLSCMSHKMKDFELQIMRKDESINELKTDLQECRKELKITKGVLPKVSDERDLMWEEVKQYSEKNMLLNSEVNSLRKKIEELDEDILVKEGQITILKDNIDSKHYNILCSPQSLQEFRLD
ncbi:hypothetical protein GIB67_006758 [Kingdonia uniflora]|uniref:DUF7653 domain-containing protein n=1 Tax=Kingdonia uniflora TaxID=39325 RepID=A0A7J7LYT8_9MAGN|nr:hypothetical protein GIB67_006758 [Kingdonia uniflora]